MDKIAKVHDFLEEIGADWVLISDPIECRYITELQSSNMYLLIGEAEKHLFTDFRYGELAESFCKQNGWVFHLLSKTVSEEVSVIVDEEDHVAIQSNIMSLDRFEEFQNCLPGVEFIRAGSEISSLFSVKTNSEIAYIRKAAQIADSALSKWVTSLNESISEREAADLLEEFCREGGSSGQSFDTIVLFGERSALPHGVPSERQLKEGDSILVDFGCVVNGFCSDMTRTFYYKSVSESLRTRYELTLKAQRAGVEALKAGVQASDVDNVVRTIIDDAGFGEYFGHGTGHGVGLRIHEQPALNKRDKTILQEGVVITVEPGIYIPNDGGVRIEDLLLVTAEGCESLSLSSRELQIIN